MAISVTDTFSNRPEHIQETARVIGRSIPRRDIYTEIYRGSKRTKTVSEIASRTGLDRKVVLNRGRELEKGGVIRASTRDGEQAYCQIPDQLHIKAKVLAIVGNPKAIDEITTKRSSSKERVFTIVKRATSKPVAANRFTGESKWRIALMLASPIGASSVNVSMEAREIEAELSKANSRNLFDVKQYPAADADSWAAALNNYKPAILHFSGHGGGGAVLLDNSGIGQVAGTRIQFATLARLLKTAVERPRLLVLNACDTIKGAEVLIQAVDVVIAMSDSIADSSAYHYARRLYSALFAGLDVQRAHLQASAALEIDSIEDALLPSVLCATGISPDIISFT